MSGPIGERIANGFGISQVDFRTRIDGCCHCLNARFPLLADRPLPTHCGHSIGLQSAIATVEIEKPAP